MTHPYENLPAIQYWRSAMAYHSPGLMNPCTPHGHKMSPADKIATMGSCFAQHVSGTLEAAGYPLWVTEPGPSWMSPAFAREQQYGMYSARYGNVYTPRQALQLLLRATGDFDPSEPPWALKNNQKCLADPFRPNIQLTGFKNRDDLLADRSAHLDATRKLFVGADWLILTLGLTECWRNRSDGAVFPIAPGVVAGTFDSAQHEFVNLTIADCIIDLEAFCQKIRRINPTIQLILTVSPVALAATFEPRHVWNSTVYSKSVLRVAAEHCAGEFDFVSYFPAYEVITSPLNAGRYLADDMRKVRADGIAHVMRCFIDTYTNTKTLNKTPISNLALNMGVLCDEAQLDCPEQTIDSVAEHTQEQGQFDEAAYLEANPDVAEAVAHGWIKSGREHYTSYGRFENRPLQLKVG